MFKILLAALTLLGAFAHGADVHMAQVRGVVIEAGPQPLIFEQVADWPAQLNGNYYRLMESQMAGYGKVLPQHLKKGQTVEFTGLFLEELNPRLNEDVWQYIYPMSLSSLKVVDKPLTAECQKRLYEKFKDIEGLAPRF